jgi:phage terminase large subunit
MFKQIKTTRYAISEADVLFDEIADVLEAAETMATGFRRNFIPTQRQQELEDLINYCEVPEDEALHILLYGSVGSAKSTTALWKLTEMMLDHPGATVLGARRTYSQIEDTIYAKAQEFFDKFDIPYNTNKKFTTIYLKNGSTYRMRSADRTAKSKDDKAADLLSTEFSGALLEEADEIPEEFVNTIPGRLRQKVGVRRKMIFYICNPPSTDHWIYHKFFVDNDPHSPKSRYRVFQMLVQDNVEHVGEGYIRDIHADWADNPALYLRMVKGLFGPSVKGYPIFQRHFKPLIHIADSAIHTRWNPNQPMYRCWDFGFLHPAIVVFQDDTVTGQIRVFEAILGEKELLDPFADRWLTHLNKLYPNADWLDPCDPSGKKRSDLSEKTATEILKSKGCRVVYKKTNIEYGLNIIAEQLSTMIPYRKGPVSAILIDPKAELMVHALQFGYCQEKDIPDDIVKPVKDGTYDHIMDAFRYGVIMCRRPKDGKGLNYKRGDQYQSAVEPKNYIAGTYEQPNLPTRVIQAGEPSRLSTRGRHSPRYGALGRNIW